VKNAKEAEKPIATNLHGEVKGIRLGGAVVVCFVLAFRELGKLRTGRVAASTKEKHRNR